MSFTPPTKLPYGKLEMAEIYFQHDGPRFFTLKSSRWGIRLLGFCVDEDEESVTYVYLAVPTDRFNIIRSGGMSLIEAFRKSEPGDVWKVILNFTSEIPVEHAAILDEVPLEWLPLEGAFLKLPTPSVESFSEVDFIRHSSDTQRSLLAIELEPANSTLTELPLRSLGHFSNYIQDAVEAIAQEEEGERTSSGAVNAKIASEVQLYAMHIRAASFVLVLGIDRGAKLMENTELTSRTLKRLETLVSSSYSEELLIPLLKQYGPRVRSRFRLILESANEIGSGLGLYTAPLIGEPSRVILTPIQVARALQLIESVKPKTTQIQLDRVALTALNTTRHTFEVRNILIGTRYSGVISPKAKDRANGLVVGDATTYRVSLEVSTDFASTDERPIEKYLLLEIESLS